MRKPKIGITLGDFNGIGPEIIIKTLLDPIITNQCVPILYGNIKIIEQYCTLLGIDNLNLVQINAVEEINTSAAFVIKSWEENHTIEPSIPTKISGNCAFISIEKGVNDLKNGTIDGLVTAPIDKANTQSDKFNFPGHTGYLRAKFDAPNGLMILTGDTLTVNALTEHIAIKDVANQVTKNRIITQVLELQKSLQNDFGIKQPTIAVLGLNPHASDNGLFGEEEALEIIPAIEELKIKNVSVSGPFAPDGIFGSGLYKNYDAILGMYHDQVLIPFKLLEFDTGVNYTSGLKGIRTSPDHGTAFDIAGKNKANPESFQCAILKAIQIFKHRKK